MPNSVRWLGRFPLIQWFKVFAILFVKILRVVEGTFLLCRGDKIKDWKILFTNFLSSSWLWFGWVKHFNFTRIRSSFCVRSNKIYFFYFLLLRPENSIGNSSMSFNRWEISIFMQDVAEQKKKQKRFENGIKFVFL